MFDLVPGLAEKDDIIELKMCKVLLEDNSYYPWVILVPEVDCAKSMRQLSMEQRLQLMREIALCEEVLAENFACDSVNIDISGNEIKQLHINIIARKKGDKDWPKKVDAVKAYKENESKEIINKIEKNIRVKMADSKYMQY